MPDIQNKLLANYQSLTQLTAEKIAKIKIIVDRYSFLRVALLLAEILIFIAFVSVQNQTAVLIIGICLLLPIAIFVIVVNKQNLLIKEETYLKNLLWVYQNEVNLMSGVANGYSDGSVFEDENHPYLSDLDIFGSSSLFALINRCTTKIGIDELAKHLSIESDRTTILDRQEAAKEISTKIDSTFEFRAKLKGHDVDKIEQIKHKLKNQLSNQLTFTHQSFLRMYVKVLPYFISVLFLSAILVGGKLWSVLGLLAFINAFITFLYSKKANVVYYGFSGGSSLLNDYAVAIKWTEDHDWKSKYLLDLFTSKEKVSGQIQALSKIIQAFDARLNILLAAFLNFFLLWDLRCCIQIDEWHKASSVEVENGLNRIGYFEELIAIATLSYNHQNWSFPTIEGQFSLSTNAIGHPLIQEQKRVDNDYQLLAQPTVDIVTGSNMAGKSTFLRTLGINMVLAYAGAPVCANSMSLSIFKVLTYMRIKDSLNESTSTFKAELDRLKMILSHVALHPNSLVLIDEMLRGTNSRDKYLGSKVFIEKLLQLQTPTLFATHDLQLSELIDVHKETVRNYHFDIQITNGEMKFDYKIKSGPCATFNAAILLKEIGLSLD
jgi:DNA mismatch repair ATPase MutS